MELSPKSSLSDKDPDQRSNLQSSCPISPKQLGTKKGSSGQLVFFSSPLCLLFALLFIVILAFAFAACEIRMEAIMYLLGEWARH